VALHSFDHHDRVVYHQSNGQHPAEQGKRVEAKAKQREKL
jgi:hypothetical protein